jgi:hypothetical protein
MAHAPEIPRDALMSIASQIGERLPAPGAPGAAGLAKEARVEIGESFPVYMLGLEAIRGHDRTLASIVRSTGVWQHQIRYGSAAQDIARSTAPPPGSTVGGAGWKVQEVVHSAAAPRIDAAIAWIDKNVPHDALANLLLVPAFYLTAFWLHEQGRDDVVIADMPPRLGELQMLRLYTADEFLDQLSGVKPISGVPGVQTRPERAG